MHEHFEDLGRVSNYYRGQMETRGLQLRHSTDFTKLREAIETLGGVISPFFCPSQNSFFRSEAFWVGVFQDGQCIGTLASRYQPLGLETLAEYTARTVDRYHNNSQERLVCSSGRPQRFMEETNGNLVYCGEFKVAPEAQKSGIGKLLSDYVQTIAWAKWPEAEMLYIFMEDHLARRGLFALIEVSVQLPRALRLVDHRPQAKYDLATLWIGAKPRRDFLDWLADELRSLDDRPKSKSRGKGRRSATDT